MNGFELKDGTVINLDYIQSVAPVVNNGFNLHVFRVYFNNHWVDVCDNTREETVAQRDRLIRAIKSLGWVRP
jgi:hypothetical protein